MLSTVAGVGVRVSAAYPTANRTGAAQPARPTQAWIWSIGGISTVNATAIPPAIVPSSNSGRIHHAAVELGPVVAVPVAITPACRGGRRSG